VAASLSATDAPSTLSELRTAFLDHLKEATGVTAINTVVDRTLNIALHDMHQERWWWSERRSTIRTYPPYSTGSVDVAVTDLTTRRTLTGTSTAWNTNNSFGDKNAIAAGAKVELAGSEIVHLISTIGSDTSITLDTTTPYLGASALDDASYTIYQDEYALASDFRAPVDLRFFDDDRTIRLIGAQEFYRLYARNTYRNTPKHATLIELGPSGSAALRRRVLFGPAPAASYVIPYRYTTTSLAVSSAGAAQTSMSATSDEPIVPAPFRMGIVWKALALWFASRQKNAALSTQFDGYYTTLMVRARQDTTSTDDRPRLMPGVAHYRAHARRPWLGRGGRYDGGTAFDRLAY